LTYQRSDGSFSGFGNRDKAGSMWLVISLAGITLRGNMELVSVTVSIIGVPQSEVHGFTLSFHHNYLVVA